MTKNTSITLSDHFDSFVSKQIKSGRYSNASEVVRDGLRALEVNETKLEALRDQLAKGAAQADRGEFVKKFSMKNIQRRLDKKLAAK